MIVMKFGGTSNEDATAMRNVIAIVKDHLAEKPVVVISAIARATNELERTARVAASGREKEAVEIVTRLFERHRQIVAELIPSEERASELESMLSATLEEIKTLVKGVAILKELTPRTMDAVCSYGERLSSRIIAAGLRDAGVKSMWVDVREFMITDDNFGNAQPLMDIVSENLETKIRPMQEKGITPVTQGFIGVTQSGEYTTMGRESSDYSASIIGAAMNASLVQIWTDVDGVLTADPRLVGTTRKIRRMSFGEAFELSHFGAKVLHPGTMLPVLEKGIPVQIRNSKQKGGTGTLVDAGDKDAASGVIKSIAYKNDMAMVVVTPLKRINQYLFWEGVFSILNRHHISVYHAATSEYRISFSLEGKQLSEGMVAEIEQIGRVTMLNKLGSLCIVGSRLRGASGITDRIFKALSGIDIFLVSFGASETNLTVLIQETHISRALKRLHEEFFSGPSTGDLFEETR